MGKTDVYSWRISSELKQRLEREARREGASLAGLLDRMAQEWIQTRARGADEAVQARLHHDVQKFLGAISGRDPGRAELARSAVRERLRRRIHGSRRAR